MDGRLARKDFRVVPIAWQTRESIVIGWGGRQTLNQRNWQGAMMMTAHPQQVDTRRDDAWEYDFASPSCLADFTWPEGAELRGNVNLVDEQMIDRQEVAERWERIKTKLLRML